MEAILFIVIALMSIGAAIMVITQRSPINSVLYLVLAFFSLAILYVMLGAQLLAAFQVIVYAGAIMVLFVFVVMMLNLSKAQDWERIGAIRRWLGFAAAAGVFLIVVTALRGSLGYNAELDPNMGTIESIGSVLFGRYMLPFEVASVLLLVAIVGVVSLVKREEPPKSVETKGGEAS
jgi:NADH-quinone oxidoreductase subunit J